MSRQDSEGGAGYAFVLASVAALGGLLFGYDTAVISGAIGYLSDYFGLDAHMRGWAASSALTGCIVGACFAGVLSDWLGRKKVLILSAVLFSVSAVLSAIPESVTQFAIARILGGLGVGAASMLSPLYIAEVAPARIRGRLVSLNQLTIVGGMLVVYFVNALIARFGMHIGGEAWNVASGWRWMFASETIPALLFFVLLFAVPESPRWLVKNGRNVAAFATLARINGADQARADMAEIGDAIAHEDRSVLQLLRPGMRMAMFVGITLAVLQQVTGINVVLYYAPEIFKSVGRAADTAIYETVIVGVVNVLFTLVAIWVVDRVGRKRLLLVASAGMGASLAALGLAYQLDRFEGLLVLLLVLAYVASFAVAMGPVVWVVLSEIFPTRVRGTAMSVATVCLWIACYGVSQTFPWLLETFSGNSFFLYAVMCVLCFFFVWRFVPRTEGRTLEEIEQDWA
ncbi:MAG TPA: sugar porter family MFS transporter [Candidatus Hydrogenedentes bacterium]|nr:sugar porter family MFS transporter [Candidatus Hydrogenedentota bacterium]